MIHKYTVSMLIAINGRKCDCGCQFLKHINGECSLFNDSLDISQAGSYFRCVECVERYPDPDYCEVG